MCFLDVYRRRIQDARQSGSQAHWTATLADPQLRIQRLSEAVAARRIDADQARWLLRSHSGQFGPGRRIAGGARRQPTEPHHLAAAALAQMLRDLRVESDHR